MCHEQHTMTWDVREEDVISSLYDDFGDSGVRPVRLFCEISYRVGAFTNYLLCITSEEDLSNKLVAMVGVEFGGGWEMVR